MKILFVCSANEKRSRTAEDYFASKYPEIKFSSAGTNHKICQQKGTTPLEENMLKEADVVYVMEKKHKDIIEQHVGHTYSSKINVLGIKDDYKYYQKELIDILELKCIIKNES